MHWIYNPDRLREVLSDLEPCPEFRPQSANPFYRRATGEQTCYGDQAYVLLESLSQCGGIEIHRGQKLRVVCYPDIFWARQWLTHIIIYVTHVFVALLLPSCVLSQRGVTPQRFPRCLKCEHWLCVLLTQVNVLEETFPSAFLVLPCHFSSQKNPWGFFALEDHKPLPVLFFL